jgi:uncharacterized protein YegP (UPF0339 family)
VFVVYRADDGWRWRARARNGRILADSGEAYTRRYDAALALERLISGAIDWRGPECPF